MTKLKTLGFGDNLCAFTNRLGRSPMRRRGGKRRENQVQKLNNSTMKCQSWTNFPTLASFLKNHPSEKIITFFSTCYYVMYHAAMLRKLGVSWSEIHEKLFLEENLRPFLSEYIVCCFHRANDLNKSV